jgi:cob(I)alamin adenosyltransferase
MVRLTRIYTRGGDGGETSLGDGSRVAKDGLRVEAFGTVDEANATIGLARLHAGGMPEIDAALGRIQNDLFDVGADLCTPERPDPPYPPLRMIDAQVERLEAEIDGFNAALGPLESFILPGGTGLSAHLHLARTVVRRAERLCVTLAREEAVTPALLRYLNRLSDLLFVLGRVGNAGRDILWVPGAHR